MNTAFVIFFFCGEGGGGALWVEDHPRKCREGASPPLLQLFCTPPSATCRPWLVLEMGETYFSTASNCIYIWQPQTSFYMKPFVGKTKLSSTSHQERIATDFFFLETFSAPLFLRKNSRLPLYRKLAFSVFINKQAVCTSSFILTPIR